MKTVAVALLLSIPFAVLAAQDSASAGSPSRRRCVQIYAAAAADPDTAVEVPLKPKVLVVPPMPPPPELEGKSVVISFVVDTTGQPDLSTLHVSGATNQRWLREVRRAFRGWRFEPARQYGCKVPHRYRAPIFLERR